MRKPKIGLLATISDGYYRTMDFPNTLLPDYERMIDLLQEQVDLVTPGIVMLLPTELDHAIRLFQSELLDGLIIYHVTYTMDDYTLQVLEQLKPMPVCIVLAQGHDGISDEFNVRQFNRGWQANSFIQITATMRRIHPEIHQYPVIGQLDRRTADEIISWSKTAASLKQFEGAQFGYLPSHCMHMYDTWVDDADLMRMFHSRFVPINTNQLLNQEIDAGELEAKVKDVYSRFQVMEPSREEIKNDVKTYLQAKKLIEKNKFVGIADMHYIGHIGTSLLMDDMIAMSAEGDMCGVILARFLMDVSGNHIQCFEHLSYDLDKNWIVGGHNSFAPTSLVKEPENIKIRTNKFGKVNEKDEWVSWGVAMDFAVKPGKVTLAGFGMSERGKYTIRALTGECVDTLYHELRMPYAIVQLEHTDVRTYFKNLALHGGGHHFVLVHGDYMQELRILADMLDIKLLEQ